MSLRNKVLGVLGAGALTIAAVMIQNFEGVRYEPYRDVIGVLTVCYGHTGNDIIYGRSYSPAECQALLDNDLGEVARQVSMYIKVSPPDSVLAAIYSFVYNVGIGNFRNSTLLVKLNNEDYRGACEQLKRWTKAGGKVWQGLINRRGDEYWVCLLQVK